MEFNEFIRLDYADLILAKKNYIRIKTFNICLIILNFKMDYC